MSIELLFSILGFIGGLLCCVGDILFDFKGKGNQKLGTSGNIDSNWVNMAYWRFGASIMFAFAGDVLVGLGIFSLAGQIAKANHTLAVVTAVCGYVGAIGGFLVHTALCIQPVIYKKIMEENQFELADKTQIYDLPGIIMPSLGLSMLGLIGIINLV